MQFIIHVAPATLRSSEQDGRVDGPCWIIRDADDPTREANVYGVDIEGGVETITSLGKPLPNTGGHGWCYLQTSPNSNVLVQRSADATDLVRAETLFPVKDWEVAPGAAPLVGKYDQFVVRSAA